MPLTRSTPYKTRHKRLCTPFTSLSAVALLTIAVGITTDGARSKAFFLAGAASSAGAATLRKRGDILSLKEENERQRDSAAAAARERANSLEEQQRQVAEDVKAEGVKVIKKIEDIEKQLKQSITEGVEQSTNKQFDAIERVRTEQSDYKKIIEQILSELQSIKEEVDIGKQLLFGDVKRQLQKLEKAQEELLYRTREETCSEVKKAEHLDRIAKSASNTDNNMAANLQRVNNLEEEINRIFDVEQEIK